MKLNFLSVVFEVDPFIIFFIIVAVVIMYCIKKYSDCIRFIQSLKFEQKQKIE